MARTLKALYLKSDRPCTFSFAGKTARVMVFLIGGTRISVDVKGMTVAQAAAQIRQYCTGVYAHADEAAGGMAVAHLKAVKDLELKPGEERILNLKAPSSEMPSTEPRQIAILVDPNDPDDFFSYLVEYMVPRAKWATKPEKETAEPATS